MDANAVGVVQTQTGRIVEVCFHHDVFMPSANWNAGLARVCENAVDSLCVFDFRSDGSGHSHGVEFVCVINVRL